MELARRAFFKTLAAIGAIVPASAKECQRDAVEVAQAVAVEAPLPPPVSPVMEGLLRNMVDHRPHMWYDRIAFKGGTEAPRMVHTFEGLYNANVTRRKTLLDSNLWGPSYNGFPAPMGMVAQRVGFLISPDASARDAAEFSRTAYFELLHVDRIYMHGRLDFQLAGERRGTPASPHTKFFDLHETLYMPSMMPWALKVFFPVESPTWERDFDVFVFLDGICDFAVQ